MNTKELMAYRYCFYLIKTGESINYAKSETKLKFNVDVPNNEIDDMIRASKIICEEF